MKEAVSRKKDAHKAMCQDNIEENKWRYKSMKNKATKAMREKAKEVLTKIKICQNWMFMLVKALKTDSKEDEEGRCMKGSGGKLFQRERKR